MQLAILHVRSSQHTLAGSLIGIVALVVTASGFFTEIEDALNVIWKAPRHESYFYQLAARPGAEPGPGDRAWACCCWPSWCWPPASGLLGNLLDRYTDISDVVIRAINLGVSFFIVSLLFAAIYKVLPNTRLEWRDVLVAKLRHRVAVRRRARP